MRPHPPFAPARPVVFADAPHEAGIVRAGEIISKMQAGGRSVTDPSGWRPARPPWR